MKLTETLAQRIDDDKKQSFANRFLNVVVKAIKMSSEPEKLARTYGKLIRIGNLGDALSETVEKHMENALKILEDKDNFKISGMMILQEHMKEASSFTFGKLFLNNKSSQYVVGRIIMIIRVKKQEIRKLGLSFLDLCLQYMSERDSIFY